MRLICLIVPGLAAVFASTDSAQGLLAPNAPFPLNPPIRCEEACLQSGGAAGSITPRVSVGNRTFKLLDVDRPVLFTFNLAEGTRAVEITWTDAKNEAHGATVSGPTTWTVSALSFTLIADSSGPAAWCTRVQTL